MKKFLTLLFIFCTVFATAQTIANGLQACYPLDNNALNYAPTGLALNGALVNAVPATGHTGLSNTAYYLNGTVGSYIELPDHPGLKNNSVFFSGWFRVDSLPDMNAFPSLEYLVYTSNGCSSNFEAYSVHIYYEFSVSQYIFCLSKCGSNCGTKPQIFSSTAPVAGNWYHICFYIDNSVMKLYVNGVFQSSVNHNVQFGYQAGKNVYLGVTNESNFNHPFKGAVDNVRFYNRELTQQEVMQLYTQDPLCSDQQQSAPVSTFSVSHHQICAGSSLSFTDQSSNAPISWNWQFPGASPGTSTLNNPTVTFPNAGIYNIYLTASNASGAGNTSVQTITVSSCVSTIEITNSFPVPGIYPNPATGRIYVEDPGLNALKICDLLGKPLNYTEIPTTGSIREITFQDVVPGIYFIKIIDPRGNCLHHVKLVLY